MSRGYSYNNKGKSPFSVAAGGGKVGSDPISNHITSHKYDCYLDVGDFVSSLSRYYTATINSNKYRSSYLLSKSWYDNFIVTACGRGDVGHRTTHFCPQKVDFGRDRDVVGFSPSKSCHTAYPMASSSSKYD